MIRRRFSSFYVDKFLDYKIEPLDALPTVRKNFFLLLKDEGNVWSSAVNPVFCVYLPTSSLYIFPNTLLSSATMNPIFQLELHEVRYTQKRNLVSLPSFPALIQLCLFILQGLYVLVNYLRDCSSTWITIVCMFIFLVRAAYLKLLRLIPFVLPVIF